MVKTRTSAEHDDHLMDEFVSIGYGTRGKKVETDEEDEGGFESDDFEETEMRYRKRKRRVKKSYHESEDERPPKRLPARHSENKRSRYRVHNEVTDGPLENRYFPQRSRRSGHASVPVLSAPAVNGDIRRSSRTRKLMYSTFNQNLIDKELNMLSSAEMPESDQGHTSSNKRSQAMSSADQQEEQDSEDEEEEKKSGSLDMYTRVKRERRRPVKRDMYGIPMGPTDDDDQKTEEGTTEETTNEEDEEEEEEEEPVRRTYCLREHKPRTNLYESAPIEPQRRPRNPFHHEGTPPPPRSSRHRSHREAPYPSPARRKKSSHGRKKRRAFHGSSSTSSSSHGESSEDDRRFERRKAKSMNKSRNRCLPMNLSQEDVAAGVVRDRVRIGSSLADVDPMNIDQSVTFESVGGLGKHVRALKEMIVFPLVYPEVFERFKISPPRGVLFYGPPGTGKTLVARALANECSRGDRKVAFFMRKGADCLSKWVGESERQLRLLFDQAYQMRPSIIFFDEIDGLAPVRSSRQDQIHSSIVSTMLALMDGLDSRGEIVVIGATNRIDSIDPALRRPGRFDREFLFPLPSGEARKQILAIHTKDWNPKLSSPFLSELADKCVGYCGADLKALCAEGALHALRRRYPQIYNCDDKLQLDVTSINVGAKDFHMAMQNIVPAAQRAVTSPARALTSAIRPLVQATLDATLEHLQRVFPNVLAQLAGLDTTEPSGGISLELYSDDDTDAPDIFEGKGHRRAQGDTQGPFLNFSHHAHSQPSTHRPRLLLSGSPGQGQSSYLGPAVLHRLEQLPVHVLDLPALYAVSAKTPEESCAQIFREARRTSPSILYLPHIHDWWDVIGDTLRATFLTLLNDMEPSAPTLFIATCEVHHSVLPEQVQELFSVTAGEVVAMQNPTSSQRHDYFKDLLLKQAVKPPSTQRRAAERVLETLPKADMPKQRKLTSAELQRLGEQEENHLRELRLFLRDVINKLGRDRKFGIFTKPVDELEVPDYYEIIQSPMDLSTMMSKIDLHRYETAADFMADIDLICRNALEYNPDNDPNGRAIRHRACALRDTAQSIVTNDLDDDFEKQCQEIKESRKRRGESPLKNVPTYFNTASQFSRRLRGLPPLNLEERMCDEGTKDNGPKIRKIVKRVPLKRKSNRTPANKSPWCKPSRRLWKKVVMFVDEHGRQVDEEGNEINNNKGSDGTESEGNDSEEDAEAAGCSDAEQQDSALNNSCSPSTRSSPRTSRGLSSPKSSGVSPSCTESSRTGSRSSDTKSPQGTNKQKQSSQSKAPETEAVESSPPRSKKAKTPTKSDSEGENRLDGEMDRRQTRSQTHLAAPAGCGESQSQTEAAARAILQQTVPPLKVDQTRLEQLLTKTVESTGGATIEQCERLYSLMSQCVFHHRREYDKTELIQDLEKTLVHFMNYQQTVSQ